MSLLNRSAVKTFALDYAKRSGRPRFERVSSDLYEDLESVLRDRIRRIVDSLPSKGKTIQLRSNTRAA